MQHFNQLTPAEAERLALLTEECAEVIQIVGKILRHGYASCHPDDIETPNRTLLTDEIGHIQAALQIMESAGDIHPELIEQSCAAKIQKVRRYLHHNMPSAESATPAEQSPHFDAEALIMACIPGGSICDPQQVADAIREYVTTPARHPDTVRLDWLSACTSEAEGVMQHHLAFVDVDLRAAIDAAMKEGA